MTISPAAKILAATMIRHFEGCRSLPYWDSYGHCWSIGYGFCTLLDGSTVGPHTPALSPAACETLLEAKLVHDYMPAVLTRCAGAVLTDGQLAALTSFAWNEGPGTLGSSGIPALMHAGNAHGAALVMQRYTYAGGVVLAGLVTRRHDEATVLVGGTWPVLAGKAVVTSKPSPVQQHPTTNDDAAVEALNDTALARAQAGEIS